MIKAIIFDCFGVLTTDGWLAFKAKHFTGRPELESKAVELNHLADAGQISYKKFIRGITELSGVSENEVAAEIHSNKSNPELFDYIRRELKPKYKIGMLSNAASNWMNELFGPINTELFDAIVISGEIGITKPDPKAYLIAANRLGVLPEEAIFIDDRQVYVDGARKVGMKSIVYTDPKDTIERLEQELK